MAIPFVFPSDDETEANYQRLDQLLADLFDVLQQILVTQRRIRDTQPTQIGSRIRNGQTSNTRRTGDGQESSSILPSEIPRVFTHPDTRLDDLSATTSAQQPSSSVLIPTPVEITSDPLRLGFTAIVNAKSPIRRHRRRRRTTSCCGETKPNPVTDIATAGQTTTTTTTTTQDWTQVGVNLRKIADDFYASVGKDEPQQSEDSKLPCGVDAGQGDASLLSMLVPPAFGGSLWTAVIFVVGWSLLARTR